MSAALTLVGTVFFAAGLVESRDLARDWGSGAFDAERASCLDAFGPVRGRAMYALSLIWLFLPSFAAAVLGAYAVGLGAKGLFA